MPDERSARSIGEHYYPLRDQVRDELRARIGDGRLPPGQRLIEQSLAAEFSVSRLPIREALRSLESEGLVTTVPRRGVVVTELSREDVEHLYDVRAVLEVLAFRLAAQRATQSDLAALGKVVQRTAVSTAAADHRETVRQNAIFHQLVVRMAANPFLVTALEPLTGRLQWIIGHGYEYQRDVSEHTGLLDALTEGDSDRAAALALSHIEAGRTHGLRNFDAIEQEL